MALGCRLNGKNGTGVQGTGFWAWPLFIREIESGVSLATVADSGDLGLGQVLIWTSGFQMKGPSLCPIVPVPPRADLSLGAQGGAYGLIWNISLLRMGQPTNQRIALLFASYSHAKPKFPNDLLAEIFEKISLSREQGLQSHS